MRIASARYKIFMPKIFKNKYLLFATTFNVLWFIVFNILLYYENKDVTLRLYVIGPTLIILQILGILSFFETNRHLKNAICLSLTFNIKDLKKYIPLLWLMLIGNVLLSIFYFSLFYYKSNLLIYSNSKLQVDTFADCFYFSVITFTTLGYGDILPINHGKLFVAFEVLIGYFYLGILISLISKTIFSETK